MSLPVVPEVVLSPEAFAADITWVRTLVCVCALMDQQVVGLGEMAATETTDVLLPRPEKYKFVDNVRPLEIKYYKNVYINSHVSLILTKLSISILIYLGYVAKFNLPVCLKDLYFHCT